VRAIPLPSTLSGTNVERVITIDSALLFILSGALVMMVDHWDYEQTGTLTVDDAQAELSAMLEDFLSQ